MRRILLSAVALAALLGIVEARGQGVAAFEVASMKAVDASKLGPAIAMNIGTVRGDRVTFGNATLLDCIRFAYGLASDQQIEAPSWAGSKEFLYDVDARALPGSTREQMQAMMQTLLAERVGLRVHRAQKAMVHYALVVAKDGSRMKPVDAVAGDFHGVTRGGHIDSVLEMPLLAHLLSRFEGERPVVDETGLKGMYTVKLNWSLERDQSGGEAAGPSLFTAVEDQLGLRLERRTGPLAVIVVDGVEKIPVAN